MVDVVAAASEVQPLFAAPEERAGKEMGWKRRGADGGQLQVDVVVSAALLLVLRIPFRVSKDPPTPTVEKALTRRNRDGNRYARVRGRNCLPVDQHQDPVLQRAHLPREQGAPSPPSQLSCISVLLSRGEALKRRFRGGTPIHNTKVFLVEKPTLQKLCARNAASEKLGGKLYQWCLLVEASECAQRFSSHKAQTCRFSTNMGFGF